MLYLEGEELPEGCGGSRWWQPLGAQLTCWLSAARSSCCGALWGLCSAGCQVTPRSGAEPVAGAARTPLRYPLCRSWCWHRACAGRQSRGAEPAPLPWSGAGFTVPLLPSSDPLLTVLG